MGKVVGPPIPNSIVKFTTRQPVFFVATAPLSSANHVNLSPKSGEEFRVLDERTVCYADYTGSGSETIAHLHENGRITIMFTAFEGSPNITRIFGTGRIVTVAQLFSRDTEENMKIRGAYSCPNRAKFNEAYHGCRGVIIVDVTRVGLSCGYSVPYMDFVKPRPILKSKLKTMNIEEYWKEKNSFSIDGLKGFYQEKTKQVPTKQWRVGGYEFAEYAEERSLSMFLSKLAIRCRMLYASGLNGRKRDVLVLLVGLVLGMSFRSRAMNLVYLTALKVVSLGK